MPFDKKLIQFRLEQYLEDQATLQYIRKEYTKE